MVIGMIRHILVGESRTVLRIMLAGALADAAPAAGAESEICIRAAGTPIQDATCGAGDGDTIYVHERICAAVDHAAAEAARKRGSGGGEGARRVNSFLVPVSVRGVLGSGNRGG